MTHTPPQQHKTTGAAVMWAVDVQRRDVGHEDVFYRLHTLLLPEYLPYYLHSLV